MAGSAYGLAMGGVAPDPMFGGGALVSAELGTGPFRHEIRVGASYAVSDRSDLPGIGGARFSLAAGTLEDCPVHVRLGTVALSPCARLDVGTLRGQGYVAEGRSDAEPWVDLGLLADGRWMLGHSVFAKGDAAVLFSLTRVRYHFDNPNVTVHQAPLLGSAAEIGIGAYFW